MKKIPSEIINFFKRQSFTVVSTVDNREGIHNSCKGIVDISQNGKIYLLDLYKAKTFNNLVKNPDISITAVSEHEFVGYCLKGKAEIVNINKLNANIIQAWENKIISRVTARLIKNIHGEKGHKRHPEALLPKPKYMIVVKVSEIVDLTPQQLGGSSHE